MLKSVAENSDLEWQETSNINNQNSTISYEVSGCENAMNLVEKFNKQMNTVSFTVQVKSKFKEAVEKIVNELNGKIVPSTKKNYFIVIMSRNNQAKFKEALRTENIDSKVFCPVAA